jgi:tetratricopeptide (TPR) repeat protein
MAEIDDRKSRIAQECYKKGTEALSKESWEFAAQMFGQAVMLRPDNVVYRQTLRGAQERKYNNNKKGAGATSFLSMSSAKSKVKKARSQQNWDDLDKAAEDGLAINPWDAQLNADVGEAARQRGYEEVATYGYQKAAENAPENKDYLRSWAEMLETRHLYDDAIKIVERLFRLDSQSGEWRSWIGKLHTNKTIHKGRFEEAESTRDVKQEPIVGYEESVTGGAAAKEVIGPGDSEEADYQRAIRKDPKNKDNYIRLADLYRRESRLEEALEQMKLAADISGGDPNILERAEDIELEMAQRDLERTRQGVAKGGEAAKAQYLQLKKDLLERSIRIFQKRIERYPADMRLKFEQAERLMAAKQYPLATKLLQQASGDPRIEGAVKMNLGKCFLAQGQNGLALKQLEQAVATLNRVEQADAFKDCYYLIARLREAAEDKDGAIDAYTEVISIDYDYKDARERMEKLQGRTEGSELSDLV